MLKVPLPTKTCSLNQTLIALLDQCQSMPEIRQIHALTLTSGLSQKDSTFPSKIIFFAALSDSGDVDYSFRLLSQSSRRTSADWNAVIRGYSKTRNPLRSISVFVAMLRDGGASPDHLTYPFLAKAAARLADPRLGPSIHGRVWRHGHGSDRFISNSMIHMYASCGDIACARKVFDGTTEKNLVSWNSMVDGYAKCGDVESARGVFESMPERDVVSWSSLIDGYVKAGDHAEALGMFDRMIGSGERANEVTMVSVLCACARSGALERGKRMHRYIDANRLPLTLVLKTSIVDMYAKCGAVGEALGVFRSCRGRETDVLIWNAAIGGLAAHGSALESLAVFEEMRSSGVAPDEVTYLSLMTACARGGLVEEARGFLGQLGRGGLDPPKAEHYAVMVDALARAGRVEEAFRFVSEMPVEPTASTLGALLSGCTSHGRLDLAEAVGRRLVEIEPDHDGRYVGLSNAYAVRGLWSEARGAREAMERRGVKKSPGFSSLEVFGSVHRFVAHDKTHPRSGEIRAVLGFVAGQIKYDTECESLEYFESFEF